MDCILTSDSTPVRRLWISVFAGYLGLGATIQEIPCFVQQRFAGGPFLSGVAVGIAFLATALCRPLAGLLADQARSRKVVIWGGVLGAIGGFGHLLASTPIMLLVARLFMGAGEAALFSGAVPWVLSGFPSSERGKIAGWFGLSMWGGLALGPALAVVFDAQFGYRGVWWMVASLSAFSACVVVTTPSQGQSSKPIEWPRNLAEVVPSKALLPGLIFGLSAYGYGTVSALIVLGLRSSNIGGEDLALPFFALGFLIVRFLGSPLVSLYGGTRVTIASLFPEVIGLLLVGLSSREPSIIAGVVLSGMGLSLMYPATVAVTLGRTGPLRPGAAVGAMTSFWDLGIMVAGPVGGMIATKASFGPAFLFASGFSVLAIFLTILLAQGS